MNHEPYPSYGPYSLTNERDETEATAQSCEAWNDEQYQHRDRYHPNNYLTSNLQSFNSAHTTADNFTLYSFAGQLEGSVPQLRPHLPSAANELFINQDDQFYCQDGATQASQSELTYIPQYQSPSTLLFVPDLENLNEESPWNAYQLRSEQTPSTLGELSSGSPSFHLGWVDSSLDTHSSIPTLSDRAVSTPQSRPISFPAASSDTFHESTVTCSCGQSFKGRYARGNLARHKRQKHSAPEFECGVLGCNRISPRGFRRMDKLRDHVRRAHKGDVIVDEDGLLKFVNCTDAPSAGEPSWHRCAEAGCEREFRSRADLNKHQRTHLTSAERPYKCPECGQSFLFPKDLRRHEETHMGASKTKYCPVDSCSHVFSRSDNVLRHIRQAHPDRNPSEDI